MAGKKTTTKRTSSKKGTAEKAPKKNNFQKWLAYMKKYPPTGGSLVPAGSTVIVTVRRQGSAWVPDRTFDELDTYYNQGIFPLLRAVVSGGMEFYPLKSYANGVFKFGRVDVEISPDKIRETTVAEYIYTSTAFTFETDSSKAQDVALGYIKLQ